MNIESKSKLTTGYDFNRCERIYELRISDFDLIELHLDKADRRIIDDINNGEPPKTPIADILLGLELIVRRIEEGKNNEPKKL